MRNYQPQHKNPYILPHNLYMQTLYLIRDYDRLKREYVDSIEETPSKDGQPRGTRIPDPTASKAIQLENISQKLGAIERSLEMVPVEYRNHVLCKILYGTRYPDYASRNTWSMHRCRFIHNVAKRMQWL